MTGPEYLYFIKKDDTHFYDKDKNNKLVVTTTPTLLEFPPEAWDETSIENIRNEQLFGVDRKISIPPNFVEDGAWILKNLAYKVGPEAQAQLVIMQKQLKFVSAPPIDQSVDLEIGQNNFLFMAVQSVDTYIKLTLTGSDIGTYVTGTVASKNLNHVKPSDTPLMVKIPAGEQVQISLLYANFIGPSTANLQLVNVLGLTGIGYGFYYRLLLKGDIDLVKFVHSGYKVTVNILEGGLPKWLKANQGTTQELLIDVPEAVIIKMDGIPLHETSNFNVTDGYYNTAATWFPSVGFLNNEGNMTGVVTQTQQYEIPANMGINFFDYIATSTNYFLYNHNTYPVVYRIKGTLIARPSRNEGSGNRIRVSFWKSVVPGAETLLYLGIAPALEDTLIPIDVFITLQPEEKLFFVTVNIVPEASPDLFRVEWAPNSNFTVTFETVYPTTYIKGLPLSYIMKKLLLGISEGELKNFQSNLLDNIHDDKVLTSGDAVRGILKPKLKISLSTAYKFIDSIDDIGLIQRQGVTYLERRKDLINYNSITEIGEISLPEVSFIDDMRFNVYKTGSPDITDVSINGKQEFNVGYEYKLNAPRSPNVLDKTTDVITGCYSAELKRVNFEGKTTTDSSQDNDVFAFHIERDLQPGVKESEFKEFHLLDRSLNRFVTSGLIDPMRVFNLGISTPFNVLRNGSNIRSRMYDLENEVLKYGTSQRNSDIVMVFDNGDVLKFNEGFRIGNFDEKYLKSILITFYTEGVYNLLQELDSDPLRVFRVNFKGNSFIFVPKNVKIQPATLEAQKYEFICGAETDLTPLIEYNGE